MIEFLQQVFNGLAIGAVYTLIAIGLTIVFGILGIAHFAHGVVAMSGGYVTFFLIEKLSVPFFVAMMLAMFAKFHLVNRTKWEQRKNMSKNQSKRGKGQRPLIIN